VSRGGEHGTGFLGMLAFEKTVQKLENCFVGTFCLICAGKNSAKNLLAGVPAFAKIYKLIRLCGSTDAAGRIYNGL